MNPCTGDRELEDAGQRDFVAEYTSIDEDGHAWYRTTFYFDAIEEQCYYCVAHRMIDRETGAVIDTW